MEWMAAMKLACRGRTMADTAGYQAEQHALRSLLRLHHNCPASPSTRPPSASLSSTSAVDGGERVGVTVQDLVAARHCNRLRHKQVRVTSEDSVFCLEFSSHTKVTEVY